VPRRDRHFVEIVEPAVQENRGVRRKWHYRNSLASSTLPVACGFLMLVQQGQLYIA
jgi:hypothetical protein